MAGDTLSRRIVRPLLSPPYSSTSRIWPDPGQEEHPVVAMSCLGPVLAVRSLLMQRHRQVPAMMGRIKVLRSLCKVLDSNFEDKLEELGQWEELEEGTAEWKTAENRLERTIQTLLETREERYNKLKECGTKVIQQWKSNDTPPSRIVDFSEALAFYDAASATESSAQLTGYKALNIDSIKKINNEILLQKSLELKKLKDKFVRHKSKLLSLIQKSHFPSSLVHFDFEMKVETNEDYFVACKELKEAISKAKAQVVKRKEIIMRTEMLELAVDQTMPLANIDGFIQVIETQVDVLVQEEGRPFIYDDGDIHLTLDRLQTIDSKKKAPQTSGSQSGEEYSGQSSLPVEPQLIASLPPHPRQPRTLRVEIRPGEAVKDDDNS
ncbi:hypothetical protein ZWY2020_004175 [Hordeum vulgare]|nr:hypothetical protein ZWY2020_004175 [Hordeum vulgare]